ncbi:Zinc finger CW-type PWWP domain protein 1 [Holothuria leucospilota]|uniref:Zinc finger CW-type PWWP domain protein 1 n=1 Tax=Holothuria leucospilota TaxID=206669 RepID=A0A9Q0YG69_HOLLE|nr:Zinc finger CW-type PWWP domain protein 1 [Holothuria leucospilota]
MPSLSRKGRKRKEMQAKKAGQDLLGDAEVPSTDPPSLNVVKPVTLDGITESNDRADLKDGDGTSDVVDAKHQLEGALSEVGGKILPANNDPSGEDVEAEAFSQESLEDIFTSTPPVNSEDDALEITPNPPSKKKVKRTKKHTHECPQNPSRKLMFGSSKKGKKASKETSHKITRKCGSRKQFQNRDLHQQGVWVQCDNFKCRKWRFLSSVTDPARVEQNWICTMHPDGSFNSCDKPEEDYTNLEFIHNKFTEGSIVWAKMQGYPWWPAMVESDPDTGCFMEHEGVDTEVTHYHCVFLDKTVSRFWVPAIFVKAFEADGNPPGLLTLKKRDYTKQVMPAKERALDALNLPLKERIERYGFGKTFKGVWREKKSREKIFHSRDEAHVEEANLEIDADDVLGDMLSSEDMEELMNETEGLMAEAEEAVQEMDEEENILGEATGEETKKIKHSRKRKLSKCDESKVKRKKHKKKKSKYEKSKKIQGIEKKSRKRSRRESALKDEVMPGNRDNIQDDRNVSCKSEEKEGLEVLSKEKKMESDNEFEESKCMVLKEDFSEKAEVDQTEVKGRKDKETCDEAADGGDMGKNETKEDEEDEDCMDTVEMEKGDEDRPVLSKEKIDVDKSNDKLDGESELGGKDLHDADKGTEDVKVKGKKDHKTTKAEREEKRKERELKKQCALEEKERKLKEREIKKLNKEKEKQEKEEKKKEREMKKQQALEEKERKKKARIEKAEKKAKKMNKLPESSAGEMQEDNFEKTPVKAAGHAKDGADTKVKKAKFSVPKEKPKAFVPPGGKPKTAIPTDQRAKAHPVQTSLIGDVDKDEKKGGDGTVALNESSLTEDEERRNVEGGSDKENVCKITNEKVKDSGIAPKLKKKKFSVKRKEVSSDSAVKAECGKGSLKTTEESVPLTTANGPDSQEGKIGGKVNSKKESFMMRNKDITESHPGDSPVPSTCSVLENNGNHDCGDIGRDSKEFDEVNKNCKRQAVDGSWPTKHDQEVNASDNDDVLDLEWSEAPEMAGKKSLVTSVNEEDSDPFEVVEE